MSVPSCTSPPLVRLIAYFLKRKLMIVVPSSATIREVKDEIKKVHTATSLTTSQSGSTEITELHDCYGCVLYNEYTVGTILRDLSEVYAFSESEDSTVPPDSTPRFAPSQVPRSPYWSLSPGMLYPYSASWPSSLISPYSTMRSSFYVSPTKDSMSGHGSGGDSTTTISVGSPLPGNIATNLFTSPPMSSQLLHTNQNLQGEGNSTYAPHTVEVSQQFPSPPPINSPFQLFLTSEDNRSRPLAALVDDSMGGCLARSPLRSGITLEEGSGISTVIPTTSDANSIVSANFTSLDGIGDLQEGTTYSANQLQNELDLSSQQPQGGNAPDIEVGVEPVTGAKPSRTGTKQTEDESHCSDGSVSGEDSSPVSCSKTESSEVKVKKEQTNICSKDIRTAVEQQITGQASTTTSGVQEQALKKEIVNKRKTTKARVRRSSRIALTTSREKKKGQQTSEEATNEHVDNDQEQDKTKDQLLDAKIMKEADKHNDHGPYIREESQGFTSTTSTSVGDISRTDQSSDMKHQPTDSKSSVPLSRELNYRLEPITVEDSMYCNSIDNEQEAIPTSRKRKRNEDSSSSVLNRDSEGQSRPRKAQKLATDKPTAKGVRTRKSKRTSKNMTLEIPKSNEHSSISKSGTEAKQKDHSMQSFAKAPGGKRGKPPESIFDSDSSSKSSKNQSRVGLKSTKEELKSSEQDHVSVSDHSSEESLWGNFQPISDTKVKPAVKKAGKCKGADDQNTASKVALSLTEQKSAVLLSEASDWSSSDDEEVFQTTTGKGSSKPDMVLESSTKADRTSSNSSDEKVDIASKTSVLTTQPNISVLSSKNDRKIPMEVDTGDSGTLLEVVGGLHESRTGSNTKKSPNTTNGTSLVNIRDKVEDCGLPLDDTSCGDSSESETETQAHVGSFGKGQTLNLTKTVQPTRTPANISLQSNASGTDESERPIDFFLHVSVSELSSSSSDEDSMTIVPKIVSEQSDSRDNTKNDKRTKPTIASKHRKDKNSRKCSEGSVAVRHSSKSSTKNEASAKSLIPKTTTSDSSDTESELEAKHSGTKSISSGESSAIDASSIPVLGEKITPPNAQGTRTFDETLPSSSTDINDMNSVAKEESKGARKIYRDTVGQKLKDVTVHRVTKYSESGSEVGTSVKQTRSERLSISGRKQKDKATQEEVAFEELSEGNGAKARLAFEEDNDCDSSAEVLAIDTQDADDVKVVADSQPNKMDMVPETDLEEDTEGDRSNFEKEGSPEIPLQAPSCVREKKAKKQKEGKKNEHTVEQKPLLEDAVLGEDLERSGMHITGDSTEIPAPPRDIIKQQVDSDSKVVTHLEVSRRKDKKVKKRKREKATLQKHSVTLEVVRSKTLPLKKDRIVRDTLKPSVNDSKAEEACAEPHVSKTRKESQPKTTERAKKKRKKKRDKKHPLCEGDQVVLSDSSAKAEPSLGACTSMSTSKLNVSSIPKPQHAKQDVFPDSTQMKCDSQLPTIVGGSSGTDSMKERKTRNEFSFSSDTDSQPEKLLSKRTTLSKFPAQSLVTNVHVSPSLKTSSKFPAQGSSSLVTNVSPSLKTSSFKKMETKPSQKTTLPSCAQGTSTDSGDTSESSDSEGEDGAALPGQKNPQKRSSLAVLMDNGGGEKKVSPATLQKPPIKPSQRHFSSEASMKLFSLTPNHHSHPLKRKRPSLHSSQAKKRQKISQRPPELSTLSQRPSLRSSPAKKKQKSSQKPSELSTLSQEELEFSKNASQNLFNLLDDEQLWDKE